MTEISVCKIKRRKKEKMTVKKEYCKPVLQVMSYEEDVICTSVNDNCVDDFSWWEEQA